MIEAAPSMEGGREALAKLLTQSRRPTAVLCVNDLAAIGALDVCREAGVQVPGHLSIVGFDGISFSASTSPPLTTVWQPAYERGCLAADLLFRRLEHPGEPVVVEHMPCRLLVRGTTGPLVRPVPAS
jgi:DNA-binding LacI/PurR family transcriptional regulator